MAARVLSGHTINTAGPVVFSVICSDKGLVQDAVETCCSCEYCYMLP